jgi:hypothetical protein
MKKKRLKLEDVVDEVLRILPRGIDVPCFTEWVKETIKQDKIGVKNERTYLDSKRNRH